MSDGFKFIEGFEGDSLSLVWTSIIPDSSPFASPIGRNAAFARTGSYGIGLTGLGLAAAASPIWDALPEMAVGFAFRWNEPTGGGNIGFLHFRGPGDLTYVTLSLNGQRCLVLTSGAHGAQEVRAVSTFQLDAGAWYYIEVHALCHASAGTVIVQVNGPAGIPGSTGAEVISVSGVRTCSDGATGYNQIALGVLSGFLNEDRNFSFDDIYVRDGAEGFVGDQAVFLVDLEDDRAVAWTRLSGAKNYLMVNEVAPDDDTTYNETDVDGAEDVFEIGDQIFTGTIHCVQLVARVRKTETQAWQLETLLDLGGTKSYSATRFLPYPNYETRPPDVFGDAPGQTGWTLQQLNDVGVGYRAGPAPVS